MQALFEKFYNKKKVLVTGGAGFIGSRLVKTLVNLNVDVSVFVADNVCSGKIDNLKNVLHKIKYLNCDLNDLACLQKLFEHNFDVVFHLAAVSSVPQANENQDLCFKTNVSMLENMANILKQKQISPTVVFSSSSAVYGETPNQCAENSPCNPSSIYAQSKKKGEDILQDLSASFGVTIFALRYFNVFDKDECKRYPSLCSILRKKLLAGEDIPVFGNGKQTRDFVNLDQIIEANLLAGTQNNKQFNVLNVASGKSVSVLDIVNLLKTELGVVNANLKFLPPREGDVLCSSASVEKFTKFKQNILDLAGV